MWFRLALIHYVTKDELEFLIFWPPVPECWDHRHVPPNPVYEMLRMKLHLYRASCMLYKGNQ